MSDPELTRILDEKAKRMSMEGKAAHPPVVKLTTSDFDTHINGPLPVFVDFWAVWCGPCKTMEPVVERLSTKYAGKVIFGKVNVDEEPEIATRYEVQSIPTFMIFKNGQPLDATIGAVGEVTLDRLVQRLVGGASSVYR